MKPIGEAIAAWLPVRTSYTELAYPATFEHFEAAYPARFDLGESPAEGVSALVSFLNRSAERCPERRYVLLSGGAGRGRRAGAARGAAGRPGRR